MAATDILTTAEAGAALNMSASEQTANATELAQVVSAASAFVDSVYGPVVARSVTKTVLSPSGRVWLNRPLSITSVTEYVSGTGTVLTAEDADTAGTYRLDSSTGSLLRRASWSDTYWSGHEIVVVYSSGRYANTAAVDPKFKEAAVAAVVHFWQHRGSQSGFGTPGGDGAPFGGVPFSTDSLRRKLIAMFPEEWTGPAVA